MTTKEELLVEQQYAEIELCRQIIITNSRGFAAISLYCPHVIKEKDMIAATDGKVIMVGSRFFELTRQEKIGVLLHEILHIALQHVQRAKEIVNCNHYAHNLATDGIINLSLESICNNGHNSWAKLPKGHVKISDLVDSETRAKIPDADWTSEGLYNYLMSKAKKLQVEIVGWEADLDLEADEPLPPHLEGEGIGSAEAIGHKWGKRLERAAAIGDESAGLFRGLEKEFPKSKTPWQKYLRPYLLQAVMPNTETNWERPSRRMVSTKSKIFEPASKPMRGIKTMGLVIDTSGSIDDDTLCKFLSEVGAVQDLTGCNIELLFADCEVAATYSIKRDGTPFLDKVKRGEVKAAGGGGTSFIPAIANLVKKKVDVILYLSDGLGNFGEEPPIPIVWAMTTKIIAPYGKTIEIEM